MRIVSPNDTQFRKLKHKMSRGPSTMNHNLTETEQGKRNMSLGSKDSQNGELQIEADKIMNFDNIQYEGTSGKRYRQSPNRRLKHNKSPSRRHKSVIRAVNNYHYTNGNGGESSHRMLEAKGSYENSYIQNMSNI